MTAQPATDRRTTADAAIDRIRSMLLHGELRAGQRLPPEEEFRRRIGVSRNAYREALKALELLGVVNVRHGAGTSVAKLDADDFVRGLDVVVGIHGREEALHLLEVRRILESAALAGGPGPDSDELARLRRCTAAIAPTTSPQEAIEYDLAFHRALVAAHRNPYLRALLDRLSTHTRNARIDRAIADRQSIVKMVTEHTGILDALVAGDPALAASLVTAHIGGVELWLRSGPAVPRPETPPEAGRRSRG